LGLPTLTVPYLIPIMSRINTPPRILLGFPGDVSLGALHQASFCISTTGRGGESSAPPPPRCARRATSWHRGCNSEPSPTLRRARIAQQAHHLDIDPLRPEWTGPYTTCPFWALWKNSLGSVILARQKAVLGVVLPALYDDTAGHTPTLRSEILIFWPPSCHARGKWRMGHGRCARGEGVARSSPCTLTQVSYPMSRAQRAVRKGRVAAHSVS
jgi:hypothetical protein